jgi:hypothetical protein
MREMTRKTAQPAATIVSKTLSALRPRFGRLLARAVRLEAGNEARQRV